MVDLPEPLSPTNPTVVPASMVKLTSSTALMSSTCRLRTLERTGKWVFKFWTSRRAMSLGGDEGGGR